MTRRKLFLVGFMGVGKSSVGRVLAERLGRPFVDTDESIVAAEGRSIERIFSESGEGAFRRIEEAHVERAIAGPGAVVATGGGVFLSASLRRAILAEGVAVWLDAPLGAVRRRIPPDDPRPLWLPRNEVDFRAFFEKRRAAYALADLRVDAGGANVEEVARAVLDRLAARGLGP